MLIFIFCICVVFIYLIITLYLLESNDDGDKKLDIILWPVYLSVILAVSSLCFLNICLGVVLDRVGIGYTKTKIYNKIDSLI